MNTYSPPLLFSWRPSGPYTGTIGRDPRSKDLLPGHYYNNINDYDHQPYFHYSPYQQLSTLTDNAFACNIIIPLGAFLYSYTPFHLRRNLREALH